MLLYLLITAILVGYIDCQVCPCEDQSTGATWGPVVSLTSECSGMCDFATQSAMRSCKVKEWEVMSCPVTINCTSVDTCNGEWAPWSNIGPCNTTCGTGIQRQARTCYLRRSTIRASHCMGGQGSVEQYRTSRCRRRECTTTTQRQTTKAHSMASRLTTAQTHVNQDPATRGDSSEKPTLSDVRKSSRFKTLTSVLSSVISGVFDSMRGFWHGQSVGH